VGAIVKTDLVYQSADKVIFPNENTKREKIFMTQSLKKNFNFLMLECMEIEVIFKNLGRSVLPLL
jgi:hypothetical protein